MATQPEEIYEAWQKAALAAEEEENATMHAALAAYAASLWAAYKEALGVPRDSMHGYSRGACRADEHEKESRK